MYIQLLITGVSMGMLYALMAMGLILIVKAVGVLNFAHGQLFMLGGYLTWMLTYQLASASMGCRDLRIGVFRNLRRGLYVYCVLAAEILSVEGYGHDFHTGRIHCLERNRSPDLGLCSSDDGSHR